MDSSTGFIDKQVAEYTAVEPRYELLATVLESILKQAAISRAPMAIVQSRAKAVSSFAGKITRKPLKDPVREFTDLCGVRVITHMPSEVEKLSYFIEQHFEIDQVNSVDISKHRKPAEFGYRSVHYIVQLKRGVFPTPEIGVATDSEDLYPTEKCPMKAEIQVRTLLEHAWADFNHDRVYKCPFEVPRELMHEVAGVAAILEHADRTFERIQHHLSDYEANYSAYMTREQILQSIEQEEKIFCYDPHNRQIALKIAMMAIELEHWPKAITVLTPFRDTNDVAILRTLGLSLCKAYKKNPSGELFLEGQRLLELARAEKDVDAIASLAGSYKDIDPDKAHALYKEAYDIDPSDPYPLMNYLLYEVANSNSIAIIAILKPVIESAIEKCQRQVEVGVNLPWAHYTMAFFYLLQNQTEACLDAYTRAIAASNADWMVETSFKTLEQLQGISPKLSAHASAQALLADRLGIHP